MIVLPKHLGDLPCSDVFFVPTTNNNNLGKHPVQVTRVSPAATDRLCAVDGASGLSMQFHGTVSNAPVVLSMHMDSMCHVSIFGSNV